MIDLTVEEVRAVALWSQGFIDPIAGLSPARARRSSEVTRTDAVRRMSRDLSAVQLDTISVLARSHELVAYARFGAIGRQVIENAYWDGASSFEYWSHAACILPIEAWPMFEFRRRHYRGRGIRWHSVPKQAVARVRKQLATDGPLTTRDIGGAKRAGEWWDWSEAKIAIEWLLDTGEAVVARREGWRRVYDLSERVVPEPFRAQAPSDDECLVRIVADAARTLGIGTVGDIADVHRIGRADVTERSREAGLVAVRVDGWKEQCFAHPDALAWLDRAPRLRHRTTLLSPFDSLIWHRPRAERIFGLTHRLEAYTPAHKRVHGYFAMPVLHGGRLVARVDPKRVGKTLHARRVTMESLSAGAIAGTARALQEAAIWVGCDSVVIDDVVPPVAAAPLRSALTG